MKAQIWVKTRNRGHDWAIFRRLDEKKAAGGLVGFMAGDTLTFMDIKLHPDINLHAWTPKAHCCLPDQD
jgi:hypothetical protein